MFAILSVSCIKLEYPAFPFLSKTYHFGFSISAILALASFNLLSASAIFSLNSFYFFSNSFSPSLSSFLESSSSSSALSSCLYVEFLVE